MYIPTWILVIAIIGTVFYYLNKVKIRKIIFDEKKDCGGAVKNNADWFEDENWKETILQHLEKFPQRTGKKTPTYNEMLVLDEDEFKAWLFVMAEPPQQTEFLGQMIDHEEKTGSFERRKQESDSDFTKLIFDIFKRERSKETIDILTRMNNAVRELGHSGDNIVKQAIYAKATSDYFKTDKNI
jgi:hypothetical protein